MEFTPNLPKNIKGILAESELNVDAREFFPNNLRGQELLKKELKDEISEKERLELYKLEREEERRLEKEAEYNGTEDFEPGGNEK